MTNTKKWVISAFECKPIVDGLTDVVSTIHWRKEAAETVGETTYTADTYGACTVSEPDAENFTAFEDLTEEVVIPWLEATLDVEAIDATLDAQIETQKNPPVVFKLAPWVTEITPTNIEQNLVQPGVIAE